MEVSDKFTVGEIVANDYRTAQVFRHYGIDFCCGGDETIEEAVAGKEIELQAVKEELKKLGQEGEADDNYSVWPIDFLTDYIINNHHRFTRDKMPEIEAYAKKVAQVHGKHHPELVDVYKEVVKLHAHFDEHMDEEEEVLFPYIKQLAEADKKNTLPESTAVDQAEDPVALMKEEHEEVGAIMEHIRKLTSDYELPEDACTTYGLLYKNLENFEKDMHKHVHLENNILFPKALKIENRLN